MVCFYFACPALGQGPGRLHYSIPTAEHGAPTDTQDSVTEWLNLHSRAGLFPSQGESTWAFLRTKFTELFPCRTSTDCSPNSFTKHFLRIYYATGIRPGAEARKVTHNSNPQLMLSERLTTSGREMNKHINESYTRTM